MKTIIKKSTPGGILRLDFHHSSSAVKEYHQKKSLIIMLHNRYGNRVVHELSNNVWLMELHDYVWTFDDISIMGTYLNMHRILKEYTYIKNAKGLD